MEGQCDGKLKSMRMEEMEKTVGKDWVRPRELAEGKSVQVSWGRV